MTFAHLVEQLHLKTGLTRRSIGDLLHAAFAVIGKHASHGDRVLIPGFGAFSLRHRKARAIANPQTKENMRIPAQTCVGFRASKYLKRKVAR